MDVAKFAQSRELNCIVTQNRCDIFKRHKRFSRYTHRKGGVVLMVVRSDNLHALGCLRKSSMDPSVM